MNETLDKALSLLKSMPSSKQSIQAHYNISQNEIKALKSLQSNKNLSIKEADKGTAVVIMSRE